MRLCLMYMILWAMSLGALEPAPVETRTIDRNLYTTLREIHNRGADLYNRGDAVGCCRVFEGALPVVRAMLSHRLNEQKLIGDALAAAESESNVSRRAFVLHDTIEKLRDRLKPSARIVEEPPTPPIGDKESPKPKVQTITSDPKPMPKAIEPIDAIRIPPKESKSPESIGKKEAARKEEPPKKAPLILIDEDPVPSVPPKKTSGTSPSRPEAIAFAPRIVRQDPPRRSEGVYGLASLDGAPLDGYDIAFHSVAQPLKIYRETIDVDGFYAIDSLPKGRYTVVLVPGLRSPSKVFPQRYRGLDTSPLTIEVLKSGERVNFILGKIDS